MQICFTKTLKAHRESDVFTAVARGLSLQSGPLCKEPEVAPIN